MKIAVRKTGRVTTLDIAGEIKLTNAAALGERFEALLSGEERLFIFNMLEVPWLDTAGISQVVACHKHAKDRGAVIQLVVRGKAHDLFTMYELQRVFAIFDDEAEALANFIPE